MNKTQYYLSQKWRKSDMDIKELRTIVGALSQTANKRLIYFHNKGYETPATMILPGGTEHHFSIKGKTVDELRKQFNLLDRFLGSETSTMRGYKKVRNKSIKELYEKRGIKVTPEQYEDFWKTARKLENEYGNPFRFGEYKYTMLEEMTTLISDRGMNTDEIILYMREKIKEEQLARSQDSTLDELFKEWGIET